MLCIYLSPSSLPRSGSFSRPKHPRPTQVAPIPTSSGLTRPIWHRSPGPSHAHFSFDFSSTYLASALLASSKWLHPCPSKPDDPTDFTSPGARPVSQVPFVIITSPCPCAPWGFSVPTPPPNTTYLTSLFGQHLSHAWTSSLQVGSDSSSQSEIIPFLV